MIDPNVLCQFHNIKDNQLQPECHITTLDDFVGDAEYYFLNDPNLPKYVIDISDEVYDATSYIIAVVKEYRDIGLQTDYFGLEVI
jgi:tRNA A37 threonylcarbamoyladenosine dehydratase